MNSRTLIAWVLIATACAQLHAHANTLSELRSPSDPALIAIEPVWQGTHPDAKAHVGDCTNLLAVRLSRNEGSATGPLPDCSTTPFDVSPALSTFDCAGLTANGCAALYGDDLVNYLSGGWNDDHELWAMPLPDDVAGGNLCIDGTRQMVYVDRAVEWACPATGNSCINDADCAQGTCEARDIPSNDWVFYTQGGPNCGSSQACLDQYLEGSSTMTTLRAPFSANGGGLLSDNPRNPFHRYNRVRLKKCNKDGFNGDTSRPADAQEARPQAQLGNLTYDFDLHFHGARNWLAAFRALENGDTQHSEFDGACAQDSDCAAGGTCVRQANEQPVNMCRYRKLLPPLSNADNVVLAGWSGGSRALANTGDTLAALLADGPDPLAPGASVHLAFDAPWKPGLESDTAFLHGVDNMYLVSDAQIPDAANPGLLPTDADAAIENGADAHFSQRDFLPGGGRREALEFWGAQLDESCLAIHGTDTWHCYERNHVLANHVTTASFTRMAQRDTTGIDSPNSRHMHSRLDCIADMSQMNCYDWVDEEFRRRTFQQNVDYFRDFDSLSEEGPGAPDRGVFAPDNRKHNGLEDAQQFMALTLVQCRDDGTELQHMTLGNALSDWVDSGQRIGAIEWHEELDQGRGTLWVSSDLCSTCPQVATGQTFAEDDDTSEWDLAVCE